jgi:alpha-galactosidase
MITRRRFIQSGAATSSLLAAPSTLSATTPKQKSPIGLNILRHPDFVSARFAMKDVRSMQRQGETWTCDGAQMIATVEYVSGHQQLPVKVESTGGVTFLHLRWAGKTREDLFVLGDAWERSYGDLEWRTTAPDRIMPWYFLMTDLHRVVGYGLRVQPSAFCFWQRDAEGISLTIDLRNGGNAADLRGRELHACTVVTVEGEAGASVYEVTRQLCGMMCPKPRLPKTPLYGSNDWNYAYGKNTAEGILRDADLIASLAPAGAARPFTVIDDGYQDRSRFPDMTKLAADIRRQNVQPGIWVRPLRPEGAVNEGLLLPPSRFGGAGHVSPGLDPTISEALELILRPIKEARQWGYSLIKHDFSTYELFGRWGFQMQGMVTPAGWSFSDRSKTNAEIVVELYRSMREAAGDDAVILGCNTVGHIAAGFFESQRIGDDTSGKEWERTRRFGVNTLSHRIGQHGTFFYVDPDIVAITNQVEWKMTRQWMDVVARSGTSFFLAPDPKAITSEAKSAIREAMALAASSKGGHPVAPTSSTTPNSWSFKTSTKDMTYEWCSAEGVSPFLLY